MKKVDLTDYMDVQGTGFFKGFCTGFQTVEIALGAAALLGMYTIPQVGLPVKGGLLLLNAACLLAE